MSTSTLKPRLYASLAALALCPFTMLVAVRGDAAVSQRYSVDRVNEGAAIKSELTAKQASEIQKLNIAVLERERVQYEKLQSRYEFANNHEMLRNMGVAEHYRKDKCEIKKRMRKNAALVPQDQLPSDIKTLLAKPWTHHA